jgi:hypothetical protein
MVKEVCVLIKNENRNPVNYQKVEISSGFSVIQIGGFNVVGKTLKLKRIKKGLIGYFKLTIVSFFCVLALLSGY